MNLVTCNGSQFLHIKRDDKSKGYIGFKYLNGRDLVEDSIFSFISDRGKLVGVLNYKVEERIDKGIRGFLGGKVTYARLYYIDIRSDKRNRERYTIYNLLIDEFCDYVNTYSESKKIINVSTFKSYSCDYDIESKILSNVGRVKFIKKGRKHYGR